MLVVLFLFSWFGFLRSSHFARKFILSVGYCLLYGFELESWVEVALESCEERGRLRNGAGIDSAARLEVEGAWLEAGGSRAGWRKDVGTTTADLSVESLVAGLGNG